MSAPVQAVILRAAELLTPPRSWTQLGSARDASNQLVASDSPQACRWCLTGAIYAAAVEGGAGFLVRYRAACVQVLHAIPGQGPFDDDPTGSLFAWNDTFGRTQAEVVALLHAAAGTSAESPA